MPKPLEKDLEFWNITPKNNIEFMSENLNVNNKNYFVYTALNDNGTNNDIYTITIGEIKGLNNNQYDISDYIEIEDKLLISPDYSENSRISNFPDKEIKKHSKYIGSIFVGIVPKTCTSVLINEKEAFLVSQSFHLNGKDVEFNLYYCAIDDVDVANLTLTDSNGTKYYVTPFEEDGLMHQNCEIIE